MNQLWAQYAARFEALGLRERAFITIAILSIIVLVGYVMMIKPQVTRKKIAEQNLTQQKVELADLQQKLAGAQIVGSGQDAANRANLERTRQQIKEIGGRLGAIEKTLVPPAGVTTLLDEILKRNHRIQLVSLRNLPVADLIERKDGKASERVDAAVAGAMNMLKQGGVSVNKDVRGHDFQAIEGPIYKHGVEIVVSGSYGDLMTYLSELERLPQKMLWNSVKLTVEEYPRTRMTITVYTLSLDKAWLTV
ncbi:MAG TPA: type II secretion system protein GspM [Burkholderiales bacterium]|nr:type II secretion system protein GspM [Burkholderiales bacterium]